MGNLGERRGREPVKKGCRVGESTRGGQGIRVGDRGEKIRTHMHADRKDGPGRQTKKDRSDKY